MALNFDLEGDGTQNVAQCPLYHVTAVAARFKFLYVTRHAKRYELGGRRHFEKIRLKVNVASRKNSTPTRVSKRSLTYYKTGSKAFFMLRFSAARLSNIFVRYQMSLLNVRK